MPFTLDGAPTRSPRRILYNTNRMETMSDNQGGRDMEDKIRLGLIGASVTGTWSARSHLPALQASSDVELTAVCTTKADNAEAARRARGGRLAFGDFRK